MKGRTLSQSDSGMGI